jgi:putative ABC transport system permease protein
VKVYRSRSIEIFTIIGVYRFEQLGFGGSTVSDRDITTTFYIPVSTAKQDLIEKNYNSITVIVSQNSDVPLLTNRFQSYFDGLYAGNETWRASVTNMTSMLDTITDTMGTISLAIAIIAGISLLVGGIGVMNIMLVSVTERTREIGTRKALGAKNFHIQFQFVTEATIIALIGGAIGLLMGIGIGAIMSAVFEVPLVISPITTMGCVLFSMLIGIFFGLYPANKAAKLDPIEALRYE